MAIDYAFVPVTRADYPMLREWLEEPHVREWWGDPDEEIVLIEEEIDAGPTDMRIVWADRPFAFIQDYVALDTVTEHDQRHLADRPADARAIDTFLGAVDYHGAGHAKGYLRQRAEQLRQCCSQVLIDPDPENARAIATYEGAGFVPIEERDCGDGSKVLLMKYKR